MPNILTLFMLGLMAFLPLQSAAQAAENAVVITVTGQGTVRVAPDLARINIGVSHIDETAALALAGMTDALNRVFAQLSIAGIAPADMQSGTLRLSRQYDSGLLSSGDAPAGFEAASSVSVFVRDLNGLGDVLDAVVQDGANVLNGLQFDVTDRAPHIRAARIAAVADARMAAETYAGAAGLSLGDVMSMQDSGQNGGPAVMAEMSIASGRAVPVAAGDITIMQSVQINYALVAE